MSEKKGELTPDQARAGWEQIARQLRRQREQEQQEWGEVDEALLCRYYLDQLTEADRALLAAKDGSKKVARALAMLDTLRRATLGVAEDVP